MLSAAVIFTTIQAQDFSDVVGDKAAGRVTLPIYAPEFSRFLTFVALTTWSMILSVFWGIGLLCATVLVSLGAYVGYRYYFWRTQEMDEKSYLIFNVSRSPSHSTLS